MGGEETGIYSSIPGILWEGWYYFHVEICYGRFLSLRVCCFKDVKEKIKYDRPGGCIPQKDCLG